MSYDSKIYVPPRPLTMKHYSNIVIPELTDEDEPPTLPCEITLFVRSSPPDRLRVKYVDGDACLEQDLNDDWCSVGTNLLFDIDDDDVRSTVIDRLKAIYDWYTSNPDVYWVHVDASCCVSAKGFLDGIPGGTPLEYTPPEPWEEPEFDEESLRCLNNVNFTDSMTPRQRERYLRHDISRMSNIVYVSTKEDAAKVTGRTDYIVSPSDTFPRHIRDALLGRARRKSTMILRSLSRADGTRWGTGPDLAPCSEGIGIISLHPLRRIVPSGFVREYVELDCRYPLFYSHIMRMQCDRHIKMIVLDHNVDDVYTRMIGEHVNPEYHTSQFASIVNGLRGHSITKPLLVCTDYPAIARLVNEAGGLVAATPASAVAHIAKWLDLMLMNGILHYTTEVEEVAEE